MAGATSGGLRLQCIVIATFSSSKHLSRLMRISVELKLSLTQTNPPPQKKTNDFIHVNLTRHVCAVTGPVTPGGWMAEITLYFCQGTGTFGRVVLARHRPTREYFALKVLPIAEVVRLKQVDHVKNEKEILLLVRHPFIVHLWVNDFLAFSSIFLITYWLVVFVSIMPSRRIADPTETNINWPYDEYSEVHGWK